MVTQHNGGGNSDGNETEWTLPIRDLAGNEASTQSSQEVDKAAERLLPLVAAHQVKLEDKGHGNETWSNS